MEPYKKQVALLLNVIPEVEKEACFALHGGTAINLFVREMLISLAILHSADFVFRKIVS
mgnify:CR=1 FL=1